jgi:hypothetical protein
MERQSLAVEGAPVTGAVRLELDRLPGPGPLRLVPVQEDAANGLAVVYRGAARLGRLALPAAIKLQRAVSLGGEDRPVASAKLDGERALHHRLRPGEADETSARVPLPQIFPLGDAGGSGPDVLPPSIVCASGRYALAPRCPRDGHELHAEELVGAEESRSLACPACGSRYPLDGPTREEVLRASVRRDSACAGCPHRANPSPDACVRQSVFLNPLPSRVLVLQAWDADLGDYLHHRQGAEAPPGRASAWARLEEHRRAARGGPEVSAPEPAQTLREVAALFAKVLDAVEQLHARQVAHLDLHPGSLALSVQGADVDVQVADLCHAHHADAPLSWRQLQLLHPVRGPFAAPECQSPAGTLSARSARWRGDVCELTVEWEGVPAANRLESPFCVGDWFAVQQEGLERDCFVVEAVREEPGRWHVTGRRVPASGAPGDGEGDWTEAADVAVFRHKHCGGAADVFSLGMILLALLCPGEEAVASYRRALAATPWPTLLPEAGPDPETYTPGALVRTLLDGKAPAGGEAAGALLDDFRACEAHLAVYGTFRKAAQDLLGIVLGATVRGGPGWVYLDHRGDDARRALGRMRVDLERARAGLREPPRPLLPREVFVFVLTRPPFVEAFRASRPSPELPAESRPRWQQQHEGLRLRLARFEDALGRVEQGLAEVDNHLGDLLNRESGGTPAAGRVRNAPPGTPEPLIRCCDAMAEAIGVLEAVQNEEASRHAEAFQRLIALAERREQHFGTEVGARGLGDEYRTQWDQKCKGWRTWFGLAVASLKGHVEAIRTLVISPWEEARRKKTTRKWPWGSAGGGEMPVACPGAEDLQGTRAAAALEMLRECGLGPGAEVDAALAMLHFEEIRSARPSAVRLRNAA